MNTEEKFRSKIAQFVLSNKKIEIIGELVILKVGGSYIFQAFETHDLDYNKALWYYNEYLEKEKLNT